MIEKPVLCVQQSFSFAADPQATLYFASCDMKLLLEEHDQPEDSEYAVHLVDMDNFEWNFSGHHSYLYTHGGLLKHVGHGQFEPLPFTVASAEIVEAYQRWVAETVDWVEPTLLVYDVGEDMMRPSGNIMLTDSPDADFVKGNLFLMDAEDHKAWDLREETCFLSGDGNVWEIELHDNAPPTFKPYLPYKLKEVKEIYDWPLQSR